MQVRRCLPILLTLSLGLVCLGQKPVLAEPIRIVAFGDSLVAGYMLPPDKSFPAQLQRALAARGHKVVIDNAGVSGDTASAGLERLDWAVPVHADAVILELGANDALRGLDPMRTKKSLDAILARLQSRNIAVLLAGMQAPRSLGEEYTARFDAIYPALANKYKAILYPFFLDGVAFDPKLNLADGIHPNAEGVAMLVERILPKVERLIAEAKQRKAGAGSG